MGVGRGVVWVDRYGAGGTMSDRGNGQGVKLGVAIVGEHRHGDVAAVGHLGAVARRHRRIVDRRNGDDNGARGRAPSVADREGEPIWPVVVSCRRIGQVRGCARQSSIHRLRRR